MMIELGLSRISRLLATTQLPWRAVHVAGTNGKGSTCAYISHMLEVYNKFQPETSPPVKRIKYGRFTSPHLTERLDCININGKQISLEVFQRIEREVLSRNEDLAISATEFEVLTATAFSAFTQADLDVGVVEVGVGGRLDATNIIGQTTEDERISRPPPLVTAITSLGFDHGDLLGKTMRQIASNKAGIIKSGIPIVYACAGYPEWAIASEVIQEQATEKHAGEAHRIDDTYTAYHVWRTFDEELSREEMDDPGWERCCQDGSTNGGIALQSAWIALHRLERLGQLSRLDKQRLLLRLAHVPRTKTWPGRMQLVDLGPLLGTKQSVLIDGAHNRESALYLRRGLSGLLEGRRMHLVTACSKGKDMEAIFTALLSPGDAVTAVEFGPVDGMPWVRPAPAESVYEAVGNIEPSIQIEKAGKTLLDTLKQAAASARANNRQLVVAGSLYLVGDVLRLLERYS